MNDAKQTILDYQNKRTAIIQQALNDQKQRLRGVASSLDRQSQTLTQIVNTKDKDNQVSATPPNLTQEGMDALKKLTREGGKDGGN